MAQESSEFSSSSSSSRSSDSEDHIKNNKMTDDDHYFKGPIFMKGKTENPCRNTSLFFITLPFILSLII